MAAPCAFARRFLLIASFSSTLAGCASFDARPKFIMKEKDAIRLTQNTTYEDTQLQIQCALTGIRPKDSTVITRENYADHDCEKLANGTDYAKLIRDRYIGTQIIGIDTRYEHFLRHVSRQFRGSNVVLDIISFGLTSAASVTGASATRALSAAASGVTGSRASISRDVFYERTLSALVDEMNAARDVIKASILENMKRDITSYSLEAALIELRAYEAAPSLDGALQKLSKSAAEDAKAADAKVALSRVCTPDDTTLQLRAKIVTYLKGLNEPKDLRTLQGYVTHAGGVLPSSSDLNDVRDVLFGIIASRLCTETAVKEAAKSWGIPANVTAADPPPTDKGTN